MEASTTGGGLESPTTLINNRVPIPGIKRIATNTTPLPTTTMDAHELLNSVVKLNINNVLEFIVDCYYAQWLSMCKNGNFP